MVGATRGTPEGFRADQATSSQQQPPAPPNLAEVMAQQTELLNQLAGSDGPISSPVSRS
jgi:hypothetical protein